VFSFSFTATYKALRPPNHTRQNMLVQLAVPTDINKRRSHHRHHQQ
jgi:hypothetical protein